MVTISECKSRKSLKTFERVPEEIYGNDQYFVPPFPGSILKFFGKSSPYKKHGELVPFVAYQNDRPVGRIAVIVNHAHNKYYRDKVGFFGFFDFIDDISVADALLSCARVELRQRGMNIIRGPYNPTVNDEVGLLVEGFNSCPYVMMPFNPGYYSKIYEQLGLQPVCNLLAFYMSADSIPPDKVKKIVERVKKSTGLTLRNLNLKDLSNELRIIRDLYNATLDRNWGFVPISLEELEFSAADLKAIVDPNLILIAEKNGKPAGFSLTIPNVNEFMWKARGSSTLIRALKFIWYLKTRQPKTARLAVLGVAPEFRNSGIAALFYYETLMRGKSNYVGGELSWVEENNNDIIKGIKVMGGNPYKTYRIYETPLTL